MKRDLEKELWNVYEAVKDVGEPLERAAMQLKALDLVVKIRCAGEKVKPGDPGKPKPADGAVENAWKTVNGNVRA